MSFPERLALIQGVMPALNSHYRDAIRGTFTEYEIQGNDWFLAYLAHGVAPEPLSAETMHLLTPYVNASRHTERLEAAVENGVLTKVGNDAYQASEKGRDSVNAFFARAGDAIKMLQPLPEAELEELAGMLAKIVAHIEADAPEQAPLNFLISRRTDPGNGASVMLRLDQYLTDLQPFRDDAHFAAWVNSGVDGRTWETLSTIWTTPNLTVAEIAERLQNRAFSEGDYQTAVDHLIELGWVAAKDGRHEVTPAGRQIREEAERRTDEIYYSGFAQFNETELTRFDHLLRTFQKNLLEMAADKATARHKAGHERFGQISQSIFKLTRGAMEPLFTTLDIAERGLAFGLLQANVVAPEPVSADIFARRLPYSATANWQSLLVRLEAKSLLAKKATGYVLTDAGRDILKQLLDTFFCRLQEIELEADVERLANLLRRVVNGCRNAPEPPGNWSIRENSDLESVAEAGPLAQIDHYLDALNAFRDGAHVAAFAGHEISGHGWELFTMIWREQVSSVAEMAEKMAFRGHDEVTYQAALDDLVARGWVDDEFCVTGTGRSLREAAELQTDRYYYFPWLALTAAESIEFKQLMTEVEAELSKLAAAEAQPV